MSSCLHNSTGYIRVCISELVPIWVRSQRVSHSLSIWSDNRPLYQLALSPSENIYGAKPCCFPYPCHEEVCSHTGLTLITCSDGGIYKV